MAGVWEPWLPAKCTPSTLGWESGEKGFSVCLMTVLHCGLVWVTPPFFLMWYLLLYAIWSFQQRPCLGFRKGLGYLKHHIPEEKSWQHLACAGGNTGSVSETKTESLWWCPALRAHTHWIISPALAQGQTQSLLDQVLWGSCYRFACSPGQGDPSLSRGLVGKWEHRHWATVGFFSGSLRGLAGAKCLADADSGPFLVKQDVETIWIMRQDA